MFNNSDMVAGISAVKMPDTKEGKESNLWIQIK